MPDRPDHRAATDENPFASPQTAAAPSDVLGPLARIALLAVVAAMLGRGAWMTLELALQLLGGPPLNHFLVSLYVKDGVDALTALAGGVLLLVRRREGWWIAVAHWLWRLWWRVPLVLLAELLRWRLPLRPPPPALFSDLMFSLLVLGAALAVLVRRGQRERCGVREPGLSRRVLALAGGTLAAALAVNGWSHLR